MDVFDILCISVVVVSILGPIIAPKYIRPYFRWRSGPPYSRPYFRSRSGLPYSADKKLSLFNPFRDH